MIEQLRTDHPVKRLCALLGVSRSGYYAWRKRPISERALRHQTLLKHIVESFEASDGIYGYPRVYRDLSAEGIEVGKHQIAGLMQRHGLVGAAGRRTQKVQKLKRGEHQADQVGCCPDPTRARSIWVGDITQINTEAGECFLATVMDKFSRKIIGRALSTVRNVSLVEKALRQALKVEHASHVEWFHSDQGAEYTAHAYREMLDRAGIGRSVSRVGNCYDNAHMESFFHSLKIERIYRQPLRTVREAMRTVNQYIDYYNDKRRHSSLGYLSPSEFEATLGYRSVSTHAG